MDTYSQKALNQFYDGNIEGANKLIKQAIEYDNDEILFNLADELLQMGQSVQSKEILEILLIRNPDVDEIKTKLAEIAVSDGDSDKAIDYLADINSDSYAYAEALLTAADVYQSMGLYEVSEQKLLEGIRMFPDEEVMKFALAELYFDQNNFEKALNFYELLLDKGIDNYSGINIFSRLGDSYAGIGKFEEAINTYEKIPSIFITEDILFKKGSLYYQLHENDKSIKVINELLDLNRDYAPAYYILANALYDENKFSESYRTAISGIQFNEYSFDLYQIMIKAAKKTDSEAILNAIKIAKKGLSKVEEVNELKKIISDYYIENENFEEAISVINSIDKEIDDPLLIWNLAISYHEIGEIKKAKDNILAAYNELQDDGNFLKDLVLILRDSGDLSMAKEALKKYLQINPDDEYMRTLLEE